jgi:hypothetical protein
MQTLSQHIQSPSNAKTTSTKPKLLKKILDQQVKIANASTSSIEHLDIELEIESYLRDISVNENPLLFFKTYQRKYPLLTKLVKRLLHVTATSVPAECLFSQTGLIDTALRNRLSYSNLEKLIFIKENSF